MKNNKQIVKLSQIKDLYDAFIFDIWGVVHNGATPYEGAVEAINNLIDSNKPVIFLSNAPRPSFIAKAKLVELGLNMDKAMIYTSGDACREDLASWNNEIFKDLGRNIYHMGATRNKDILKDLELETVDQIQDADLLILSAFMEETEDLNQYDDLLKTAAKLNLPAICPNPDIQVMEASGLRFCAGFLAQKYLEFGGLVHYYGKPDQKIYQKILPILAKYNVTDKSKILMIGDTMYTDILGANNFGIDSLLLLTGNGATYSQDLDSLDNLGYLPSWIAINLQ